MSVFDEQPPIINKKKLKDSKKLSKNNREILEKYIKKNSYWSTGSASLTDKSLIYPPIYFYRGASCGIGT